MATIYVTKDQLSDKVPNGTTRLFAVKFDLGTFGGSIGDMKGFLLRLGRARHLANKVGMKDGQAYIPSGGKVFGARETRHTACYTVDKSLNCQQWKLNIEGKYVSTGDCPDCGEGDNKAMRLEVNGFAFHACKHTLAVMLSGQRGRAVMFVIDAPDLEYRDMMVSPEVLVQTGTGQEAERSLIEYTYSRAGFDARTGLVIARRLPKRVVVAQTAAF